MPNQILIRAYEVLSELEKNTLKKTVKKQLKTESKQLKLKYSDPEFDKIKKIIEEININNINPVHDGPLYLRTCVAPTSLLK